MTRPTSRKWRIAAFVLTPVIIAVIVVRLYMGIWVLDYVNHVINNIDGYEGSVASIDLDLYRGAYKINRLKLYKKIAGIPTPFINIEQSDISIQWAALFHGRIVSSITLLRPVLNFAVSKSGDGRQTGGDADWTKPIKDLAPVDINRITFQEGKLTFQDFSASPKVNLYIHHMNGEVRNLRNVSSVAQSMPSTLTLDGTSIGDGKLSIRGKLNILKEIPDMDLSTKLENVNLVALNDYSNAYAALDIRKGNLSVYSELIIKNNHVSGYVKPLATNISLIDLHKDSNPVKVIWESVASVVLEIFTNHHKEQFATDIKLQGDLDNIKTNIWSTVGGIIHNAFVNAYQKGWDTASEKASSASTSH